MDEFQTPTQHLPPRFYRVQHPHSSISFSPKIGFVAPPPSTPIDPRSTPDFALAFARAFRGGPLAPNPFVLLYADKAAAEQWVVDASLADREDRTDYTLYTLESAALARVRVFKLSEVVEALRVPLSARAARQLAGCYFCLAGVPGSAVVEVETLEDVLSKRAAQIALMEQILQVHVPPAQAYVPLVEAERIGATV